VQALFDLAAALIGQPADQIELEVPKDLRRLALRAGGKEGTLADLFRDRLPAGAQGVWHFIETNEKGHRRLGWTAFPKGFDPDTETTEPPGRTGEANE
jgi:hypothetical protein